MDLDEILAKAGAPKARPAAAPAAEEPDGDKLDAILAKVAPPPSPAAAPAAAPADPSIWERIKAGVRSPLDTLDRGASIVGAAGTQFADAATMGGYSAVRNYVGNKVAPDATAAQMQTEQQLNADHPLLMGIPRAAGYMLPMGAPNLLARGVDSAIVDGAQALPGLAGRALGSGPVRGALTGAATNAGTAAVEDMGRGASPMDALGDAGNAALTGGVLGGAAGTAAEVTQGAKALAAKRAQASTYQDLGRSTGTAGKTRLEALGPEAISKVDQEFGISEARDPRKAIKEAKAAVGQARDEAFKTISAAGGDVGMDAVARRLDDLQTDFAGDARTRHFAEDVAKLRGELLRRYGEAGKMTPKALANEISGIDDGAYGSNYANPKTAQIVKRRTSGALREVQAKNLDAVAQLGPEEAAAVQTARDANEKFGALLTMEPIVKAKVVKKEFEPGFADKAIDNGLIKTAAHAAKDKATGMVDRAISAVGSAAPSPTVGPAQVARLIQMARSGANREQITAQAQTDGTPPEIAANIAQQYGR